MKTMSINGKEFTVKKDINGVPHISNMDIYSAYERPSRVKVSIYNEWLNWFLDLNGKMGISSYNGFMFTIEGLVNIDNVDYYIYITRTRQEISKIVL